MILKKVLVVGAGGREHALALKLSQSIQVEMVFVAPGNFGMINSHKKISLVDINALDGQSLLNFALKEKIELTIVGPETVLSMGIVDLFRKNNLLIVGPSLIASKLETSKIFAKKIMIEAQVPTAAYDEFDCAQNALAFIDALTPEKMVIKCDSLAAGKGVIVCQSKLEMINAVNALMKEKLLGENVNKIIIEEFFEGQEVSAFALCDGENFSFLGTACDHKRLKDGDQGPNTGGMGVYSPASNFTLEDEMWVNQHIFSPVLKVMKEKGIPFSGILFAGLMKTKAGWKVLEFNVRLGDPETQVLLPLIEDDLYLWFMASAEGKILDLQKKLNRTSMVKSNLVGVHVVMAAYGYPGTEGITIRSGDKISFDENFHLDDGDYLFIAGVSGKSNELKTNGGRVLGITSLAPNFTTARKKVYALISKISFEGAQFRLDIGSGQL